MWTAGSETSLVPCFLGLSLLARRHRCCVWAHAAAQAVVQVCQCQVCFGGLFCVHFATGHAQRNDANIRHLTVTFRATKPSRSKSLFQPLRSGEGAEKSGKGDVGTGGASKRTPPEWRHTDQTVDYERLLQQETEAGRSPLFVDAIDLWDDNLDPHSRSILSVRAGQHLPVHRNGLNAGW